MTRIVYTGAVYLLASCKNAKEGGGAPLGCAPGPISTSASVNTNFVRRSSIHADMKEDSRRMTEVQNTVVKSCDSRCVFDASRSMRVKCQHWAESRVGQLTN